MAYSGTYSTIKKHKESRFYFWRPIFRHNGGKGSSGKTMDYYMYIRLFAGYPQFIYPQNSDFLLLRHACMGEDTPGVPLAGER